MISVRRKAKQQQNRTSNANGTTIMKLFALDKLKPKDLNAFVYGNNQLKNCVGLLNIENHYSEDNLKGVKFRKRASAVYKLLYL